MKVSVVMIAKNADATIASSLESLIHFDEVILYLNNSTDNTETIAKTFKNVNIIDGTFDGFGTTKNRATSYARNSWILSLDSDELISKSLFDELNTLSLNDEKAVFIIKRDNYFLNKKINYSGWGNDYLVRVYNKNEHGFNNNIVHEKIILHTNSKKIILKNSFKHLAVIEIGQFLSKINSYSKLGAVDKMTCSFTVVIFKSLFAFIKTYFIRLAILDGYAGFVIAISDANGRFYRYVQRYINCKK